jgi:hypothetical protein
MKYLLMIYTDELADSKMNTEQQQAMMGAYFALTAETKEKKAHFASEALFPTASATTVRVRDGKLLTTDGPFAETKEQLGGFYLLECANLDEAIQWAAKVPSAVSGSIEVRPVVDFTQYATA